jgi:hypothetical protein
MKIATWNHIEYLKLHFATILDILWNKTKDDYPNHWICNKYTAQKTSKLDQNWESNSFVKVKKKKLTHLKVRNKIEIILSIIFTMFKRSYWPYLSGQITTWTRYH